MNCACIGSEYDEGGWSFEPSETYPVAKKNWKCCECGRQIPKGEKYYCLTGKWHGEFFVERMCMDCRSVTEHLFCGFTFGQVWEDLRDHLYDTGGEISWEKVARLTPAAREKVCAMIEDVWRREKGV